MPHALLLLLIVAVVAKSSVRSQSDPGRFVPIWLEAIKIRRDAVDYGARQ
jgi:hypothetical protein